MTQNKIIKLLNNFCTRDVFRPALQTPNAYRYPQGDYIMASDGIRLVGIPASFYPDHKYKFYHELKANGEHCTDFGAVCRITEYEKKAPYELLISDIDEILENIKKTPEYQDKYKECDECDGEGQIQCSCCGHEYECEECDGEGEVICGKEETGYHKFPEDEKIVIMDSYFNLERIDQFFSQIKELNCDRLQVHDVGGNKALRTSIEGTGIVFMLMPVHEAYASSDKTHTIKLQIKP